MQWIFYLFLACILVSLSGIVAAVILFLKQNRIKKLIRDKKEPALVTEIANAGARNKSLIAVFRLHDGTMQRLVAPKEIWEKLYVNDNGTLVHWQGRVLFFEKKSGPKPKFFQTSGDSQGQMLVSLDSPRFGLHYATRDKVHASLKEACDYAFRMFENRQEHFFGLTDAKGDSLEISGNENGFSDIRYLFANKAYVLTDKSVSVKDIITDFYAGKELLDCYPFHQEG